MGTGRLQRAGKRCRLDVQWSGFLLLQRACTRRESVAGDVLFRSKSRAVLTRMRLWPPSSNDLEVFAQPHETHPTVTLELSLWRAVVWNLSFLCGKVVHEEWAISCHRFEFHEGAVTSNDTVLTKVSSFIRGNNSCMSGSFKCCDDEGCL